MGDYAENYPTELGRLKRAAIDAWAKENYDSVLTPLAITETAYTWSITVTVSGYSTTTTHSVTRPGVDGLGGGDYSYVAGFVRFRDDLITAQNRAAFDRIRLDIDTILSGCDEIPDPASFQAVYDCLNIAVKELPGAVFGQGSTIPGALSVIHEKLDEMDSLTVQAFRYYLSCLPTVINNFGLAVESLFATVQGEQGLWTQARLDIMNLVRATTRAFDDYAQMPTDYSSVVASLGDVFDVVGAVAGALTPWGATKLTAQIVKGAVTILGTLADKETEHSTAPSIPNFTGVMDALRASMGSPDGGSIAADHGLRRNLFLEEQRLAAAMTSNTQTITENTDFGWDLSNPYKGKDTPEELWPSSKVDIDVGVADTIGDELARIYRVLFDARQRLDDAVMDFPWQRADNIGYTMGRCNVPGFVVRGTETGCYRDWCACLWALHDRIDNLAFELEDDSVKFPKAIHALKEYDDDARQKYEFIAYAIGDDYGYPGLL